MSCSTVILMCFFLREKVINKTCYSSVFISESSCKLVDSWSIISKSASSLSWSKDSNSLFYCNISKNLTHSIQDSSSVFFLYTSTTVCTSFRIFNLSQLFKTWWMCNWVNSWRMVVDTIGPGVFSDTNFFICISNFTFKDSLCSLFRFLKGWWTAVLNSEFSSVSQQSTLFYKQYLMH